MNHKTMGNPATVNVCRQPGSVTTRDLAFLEQRLENNIEAAKWEIIALLRAAEVTNALAAPRRTLVLTTLGGLAASAAVLLATGHV